ncbi:MAG: Cof-type HAD-IIB family hydrolase [Lachnospiraceae bacterium]|nr:Cof-type HAD-IIB family hydrolase [Lachnospiraceae bacterium]
MKIFFSDLDGTLLNDRKKIDDRTRSALERFIEAGNAFAVSTGRAMDSAMMVRDELELFYPRTFLIGYNGAQIYDCARNETIRRVCLDRRLVKQAFQLAKKRGIHIHTYNETHIITPVNDDPADMECVAYYRRVIKSPVIFTDDIFAHMEYPPCKCIAIELHDRDRLEAYRQELAGIVGNRITLIYSSPYYLELFDPGAGKGSAVTELCGYLGIDTSSAIAAGDQENDQSMIETAGVGIAMRNGDPAVWEHADIVTDEDNNHNGLAKYLEALI